MKHDITREAIISFSRKMKTRASLLTVSNQIYVSQYDQIDKTRSFYHLIIGNYSLLKLNPFASTRQSMFQDKINKNMIPIHAIDINAMKDLIALSY